MRAEVEEWKDIAEYTGLYQVSNFGRVRSLERVVVYRDGRVRTFPGVMLSPGLCRTGTGYWIVVLSKRGKTTTFYVHVLVAEAFIPKPEGKVEVNHIKDSRNNMATNLEWVTHQENAIHSIRTGQRKIVSGFCSRRFTNKGVTQNVV